MASWATGSTIPTSTRSTPTKSPRPYETDVGTAARPIWVTAETQGMVAAAYFIPGTEAAIQGVRPTFWTPYDSSVPNQARVEHVLAWLKLPPRERPHLITLYFSTVRQCGTCVRARELTGEKRRSQWSTGCWAGL